MINLAVAVVIGAAFGPVVPAYVKDLLTPLIAFILVAAAAYSLVVVPLARLKKPETAVEAKTRPCPECLSEIPLQARRCAHCGEPVAVAKAA